MKSTLFKIDTITLIYCYILFFPLFTGPIFLNTTIGGKFVWLYFLPINFVSLLGFLYNYKGKLKPFPLIFLLFVLLPITISTAKAFEFMPLFFFFNLIAFYYFIENTKLPNYDVLSNSIATIIVFGLILSFFNFSYNIFDRFVGFSLSPTTFGMYIMSLYVLLQHLSRNKILKLLLYLTTLFLLLITKTRLNILFFVLLPFTNLIIKKPAFRKAYLIGFLIIITLSYPIYNYLSITSIGSTITEMRYEDGRDASAQTRIALFTSMLDEVREMDLISNIFGKGAEYSRNLVKEQFNFDIQPHNDFIRLYIDFGSLVTLVYLFLLSKHSLKNGNTLILLLLYFVSFYHNMIFNFYIIFLLIISLRLKPQNYTYNILVK